MRNMLIVIILISAFLAACSKWNVVHQGEVDFKVTTAGFSDEKTGITVGYAGECHFTTDGGKDWDNADNKSWCRFGLEMVDNNVAIHCGNAGHVGFSKDGGKTWQLSTNFGDMEPQQCRYLSFPDQKTGWIASPNRLAFTIDEGAAWNELALPRGVGAIEAISLWAANNGCILDNKLDLYFTSDGGKSWENQKVQTDIEGIDRKIRRAPNTAMRFFDRNKGIIVFQVIAGEEIKLIALNTSDGGKSWVPEDIPAKLFGESVLFLSRDAKILTVYNEGNGIMVIKNNGA
jgi:photosystem II stability/assembly factor-like uncharacterized protein